MSSKPEFVHLHNHSEYSLLDGILRFSDHDGKPSELIKSLAKEGARGFAVTDHGNMYGAMECYSQCSKEGLKPVIGSEFYIVKGSRLDRGHPQRENRHVVCLAKDYAGYQNLMALSSAGFLEGFYYDPRIDREILARHSKGLVILSGCVKSEVCQAVLAGDMAGAETLAASYRDLAEPGCFFLEMMDHGIEDEKRANAGLMEIHRRTGIPLVATNDCHYARKSDQEAHDARLCISTGALLADGERLRFAGPEFYVKSPAEMAGLFESAPEAVANTVRIAEMCNLQIPKGKFILPEFAVPEGMTQGSYLERLAREGLRRRFPDGPSPAHHGRLAYELSVIQKKGFAGYFLVVWDFIAYARREGIPVGPGRGSGAGSLVAYALDITNLDPLEHKLLFERFLNPDRPTMPDLDIDFADTDRDRIIEYVRGKYGASNVAQIISFSSMGAKGVIRDVGRVMGISLPEVDRIAKMVPGGPDVTLYGAIQKNPDLPKAAQDPQIKKLLDLSLKLEGLKRHTTVHAAGTVITKEPVVRYSPLARNPRSDVVTTQYDGDVLPALGLLKVDFLGLRTLTIIQNTVRSIRTRKDPAFDIEGIPMDDPKTYELLRRGESLAVFQLDSSGMRTLLQQLKPTVFNDIVAILALYRPGPMKAGMVDMFVERKHGRSKVSYDHPLLQPVLQDTYGCIVFQEQVMEISKELAGFTGGQADTLRKAMGKKTPEDFEKMRPDFVSGAAKNKIPPKLANKIYDHLLEFGGYGFNRSHTAAYGLLAYQTAYLKANHALEFMCAVATSEIGHSVVGSDDKENKLAVYLEDGRRTGLKILPPDVQRSGAEFTIENPDAIRFGLVAVKNVGLGAAEAVVGARSQGPFKGLADFCSRVDLKAANKKAIESLIRAGALDALDPGKPPAAARARLLASLEETADRQAREREDLARGQATLFAMDCLSCDAGGASLQDAAPWSSNDVLRSEKEMLGFYFSGHPLLEVRAQLQAPRTHDIAALSPQVTTPVRLAGLLAQVKRKITKKGEQMAEAVLEDLTGSIRLLVFPRAYSGTHHAPGIGDKLQAGAVVVASGRLSFSKSGSDEAEGGPELFVDDVSPLAEALPRYARKLVIAAPMASLDDKALRALRDVLESHRGRCPVELEHRTTQGVSVLEVETRVLIDQNLLESLDSMFGEKSWRIESAS
ncbi:MAG: DNA polymerase III subunit alpha [Elusimicrobia bacterium]|nr:DNA polymerase III subunit alpha [Elusimicrobiota bacterium]